MIDITDSDSISPTSNSFPKNASGLEARDDPNSFWNKPMYPDIPECQSDFKFSHKIVDLEDVEGIFFGSGSHVAPHDHMATWSLRSVKNGIVTQGGKEQIAERVQLYTPTDIFHINIQKENRTTGGRITNPGEPDGLTYVEWGGYFFGCDGHVLMIGHLADPSDEMKDVLSENEPTCDKYSCRWEFSTFIPSGTPIFRTSGYVGIFDFGLRLARMTSQELQQQPGYGYSVTPWRTSSGNAVCPLEYFLEPLKSEYLDLLGSYACGPFNQDVPGTAMGYWFPSPSPDTFPGFSSPRDVDEWTTVWLFESYLDSSINSINIGNNTFGLNQGTYSYTTSETGLINQRWDVMKPGQTYCVELRRQINNSEISSEVHKIMMIEVYEDGAKLKVEAVDNDKCGIGPWDVQEGATTFHR
tara:strand:+ start:5509 stop:6744 length:1236 start_codon:yes stop_codon:yes gene_type:complete